MKLVDISGTKRRNIRKLKLMNLQLTVRTKIWICEGALVTKKGYQPRTNIVKDEEVVYRLPQYFG
jgi:hypothetical protein